MLSSCNLAVSLELHVGDEASMSASIQINMTECIVRTADAIAQGSVG